MTIPEAQNQLIEKQDELIKALYVRITSLEEQILALQELNDVRVQIIKSYEEGRIGGMKGTVQ